MVSRADEQKLQIQRALAALKGIRRPHELPLSWKGIRFDAVADADEMKRVFVLRFQSYTECGFIRAEDFPLGMEVDEFDVNAVHFVAEDPELKCLVGYVRLVLGSSLQLEKMLSIDDYRSKFMNRICEMSRLIVRPPSRRYVSRGVRYVAHRWAERLEIERIVGISLDRDKEAFDRRLFLPMNPPRGCVYEGTHFRPLVGMRLYGNVFDVTQNQKHTKSLLDG